ncbi:MAG: SDR family NAD(P)-dependent oxidoreductase [Pseudomonadota bacterium]
MQSNAIIVGAGTGLSASLTRQLAAREVRVTLGARNPDKLSDLCKATGVTATPMDGSDPAAMAALFASVPGRIDLAVYNPSARVPGPITDIDPEAVRKAVEVTAFGAFLLGQQAARRMLAQEPADGTRGTILMTGASAGDKGFARSAAFAMGKFAQRGLAQSMARELHPQGVHVAWINIDGGISNPDRAERTDDGSDRMLDPEAIAAAYLGLMDQHRSAWSHELALRPWVERF